MKTFRSHCSMQKVIKKVYLLFGITGGVHSGHIHSQTTYPNFLKTCRDIDWIMAHASGKGCYNKMCLLHSQKLTWKSVSKNDISLSSFLTMKETHFVITPLGRCMRHDLIQDPASFQKILISSLGVNVARVGPTLK